MSDVSAVVNFFSTANEGFITTANGTILSGAANVTLNSTAGLTNGTIFVGIIEPGGSKQQVFTGTVDTALSRITDVKWTRGTNADHLGGVTIVDYVTGTDWNMMSKGIQVAHNQDGTHKSGAAYPLATISDFTNANHNHQNAAGAGTLNAANALQAGSVNYAKLLTTIFSGQVQTYTPTMSGQTGGSWVSPVGYYINLGGIKLAWGTVGFGAVTTQGRCTLTQPPGFFSTIQIGMPAIESEGNYAFQTASGDGFRTDSVGFYVNNSGSGGSCTVSWFCIGT